MIKKYKQFFIVGDRPVFISPKEDESFEILAFSWRTGLFENDISYLSKIFFSSRDDIEEVSEKEFNAKVTQLREAKLNKNEKVHLIEELQDAWRFVSKIHYGQKYGGNKEGEEIEYINHIGSVVFEIWGAIEEEKGLDKNLSLKCAILHDTLEDSSLTYEGLEEKFGRKVADGVLALTKNEELKDKRVKMLDSLKRIKKQPREVWIVKMADRIANLYSPPYYWTTEKKREYLEESQLIYNELHRCSQYLANRLLEKIKNYPAGTTFE